MSQWRRRVALMEMSCERVSVVIPAYKAAATIGGAVESVLAQTHPAAEIIVIDDGSPDDIVTALAPYGERVTLIRQANGGAASARNTGIDRAAGDLVAFLDADDYWEPQKLERHVELYRRYPDLGMTCSRYYSESPGQQRVFSGSRGMLSLDQLCCYQGGDAFVAGMQVWTGTVVVPRRLLHGKRFESGLETAEDRHLWIRLILAAPIYCLSEPLATAVLVPNSLSRSSVDRDCRNMLEVVRAFRGLLSWNGLRAWEAHVYRRWASGHLSNGAPLSAIRPAMMRLFRQPWSIQAWWIVGKCCGLALRSRNSALVTYPEDSTKRAN